MAATVGRSIYKRVTGTIHQGRIQAASHLIRNAMPTVQLNAPWTGGTRQLREGSLRYNLVEGSCKRAQALIALFLGELNLRPPASSSVDYPQMVKALIDPDAPIDLSSVFSAALITDTPGFVQKAFRKK